MLALIAGKGGLPISLVRALDASGASYRVYSLAGFEPDLPDVHSFRVEALGQVLSDMVADGVAEVCFAGAMQRPPIDPSALHPLSLPLVPRLMGVLQAGDDRLLREVIAIFEETGLSVRGAHEIAPELVAGAGPLGATGPDAAALADAARGGEILATLGPLDIGQGCVVQNGLCLAVETLPGTDAMLRFVAQTRGTRPAGGVLVKRAKAQQDLRIDMPAIGPETVRNAQAAGVQGIALEAGRVLLLDRAATVAAADAAGIAIWGSA